MCNARQKAVLLALQLIPCFYCHSFSLNKKRPSFSDRVFLLVLFCLSRLSQGFVDNHPQPAGHHENADQSDNTHSICAADIPGKHASLNSPGLERGQCRQMHVVSERAVVGRKRKYLRGCGDVEMWIGSTGNRSRGTFCG